jgi:chromosome segregation protein
VKSKTLEPGTLAQVKSMKGYEGIAADMVSCDQRFSGIIQNLLGRTVVVDNMDSGIEMARRFDYAFRIVTLEGELLNAGGSLTGGSTGAKTASLMSRNRIIKELEESIKAASHKQKAVDREYSQADQVLKECVKELEAQQKALSDLELIRLRDESHVARIIDNIKRLTARVEMLRQQDGEIDDNIKKITEESQQESVKAKGIEEEIQSLKELVQSHQIKNRDEQQKRDEIHTDINDYKVSVNSIAESRQSMEEQLRQLIDEQGSIAGNLQKREAEQKRNLERIEEYKAEIARIKEKISRINEEKTGRELKAEGIMEEVKS